MITKVDNIILLGTSHVATQSVEEIKQAIEKYKPEVVAIELDYTRLKSLLSKNPSKMKSSIFTLSKEYGFTGALFAKLAHYVQQSVGKNLNIDPGVDMKTAYEIAREKKIPTALIDQHIKITLKKFSDLPFRRKISMLAGIVKSGFKKENKKYLNLNIVDGVPNEKAISKMLEIVEKEVKDLYTILIDDRNHVMSDKLIKLREKHQTGDILAVVGAGHVKGMKKILKEKIALGNSFNYSFTVEI